MHPKINFQYILANFGHQPKSEVRTFEQWIFLILNKSFFLNSMTFVVFRLKIKIQHSSIHFNCSPNERGCLL